MTLEKRGGKLSRNATNYKETINAKGIGNSATIAFDIEDHDCAHRVLLSLRETVGSRLRQNGYRAKTVIYYIGL